MAIELSNITFTEQDDIVPASGVEEILNTGIANTLAGNDRIIGTGLSFGLVNYGTFNSAYGNDIIIGICSDDGYIGINNRRFIDTDDGNDIITGTSTSYGYIGINNASDASIDTGDGDDIITAFGTGDAIINSGTINTGNGNDSIITSYGDFYSTGSVFLGDGTDYLKRFGNGSFNGGNGEDTLDLKQGYYTIRIWGTTVSIIRRLTEMKTYGFEKLIAGDRTYDFSSLTDGQQIAVD